MGERSVFCLKVGAGFSDIERASTTRYWPYPMALSTTTSAWQLFRKGSQNEGSYDNKTRSHTVPPVTPSEQMKVNPFASQLCQPSAVGADPLPGRWARIRGPRG